MNLRLLGLCLSAALVLCILGGQGGIFFANDDWLIRNAVLTDLAGHRWPLGYMYEGEATLLRAPLGLYLVPAWLGHALGVAVARVALLVQNTTVLGCLFYVFVSASGPGTRAIWLLIVFTAFSGWDLVGQGMLQLLGVPNRPTEFSTHLERWAGILQFSSHVTQIFWVPNHAISGWGFVASYLLWRRRVLSAASVAIVFGFSAFWSPLSAIGAVPFLVHAFLSDFRRGDLGFAEIARIAGGGLALLPIGIYLALDSSKVPHGQQTYDAGFALIYAFFLSLELVPFLLLLLLTRRAPGTDLAVAIAVLLAVPLFRIGGTDFVMRASIPALAILALRIGEAAWPVGGSPVRRQLAGTLAVLLVGAATPVFEIGRAVLNPAAALRECNLVDSARSPPVAGPLSHYLARVEVVRPVAGILSLPREFLGSMQGESCWPERAGG